VYRAFGIENMTLRINTLGTPADRAEYVEALRDYLDPHRDELSETSQRRLQKNPLRVLDTKLEHEQDILQNAPRLIDFVDEESQRDYEAAKALLDEIDVDYVEDPFLVRGLDYYTRLTYELESPDLGAQSALAGGGRYDLLAQALGSDDPVPATGFAAGMERLFLAIEAADLDLPAAPKPDVFIAALGDDAERWVFRTAQALRDVGLGVALDLKGRSLKAQMKEANRQDAPYTLIVGGNELEAGSAQVKEMATGKQVEVAFEDLATYLKQRNEVTPQAV
jgi:histidyl-tRNA synthetase